MIEICGASKRHGRGEVGDRLGGSDSDAELYERLAPELIRFAALLVGPSDAEDLLGAAVLKAISSPRWSDIENRRAYLYRTLTNEAHSNRRSFARRRHWEQRAAGRDAFEYDLIDPDVMRSLRSLSIRQRAVIHLTYWADLAPRQVAAMLGLSLRTVERELMNARKRLGQELS